MDPASALTGKTQISVHCSQCNFTITKWINQVRTVDSSVTVFKEELLALQLTFDRLSSSLKDSAMVDAARITDQHAGGALWSQISTTLDDCQTIILTLKQALENIEYGSRRISSMLKHLAEALNIGELVFMRDTVKLLDLNMAFPITMINICILLQRPDLRNSSSKFVVRELAGLKSEHDGFASRVRTSLHSTRINDNRVLLHMQEFSLVVEEFLTNTAAILNNSPLETTTLATYDLPPVNFMYQAGNEVQIPLPDDNATIHTVETYEELDAGDATLRSSTSTPTPEDPVQSHGSVAEERSDDENEIELELTLEYMANGQADLEIDDFAGAEENFRRALEMAEENDFSKHLEYGPGDITLMLADCLMQQEKEEEALELLEPIADGTSAFAKVDDAASRTGTIKENPESGLQYKANHILGVVFLRRLDYAAAEKRAKQAFKGRRRLLGAQDPMTLESVQLIIDIYTAKDDKISARAYKRFLEPPTRHASKQSTASVKSPTVLSPRIQPTKSSASQRTVASAAAAPTTTQTTVNQDNVPPSRASTVASTATRSIPTSPNLLPPAPLQPKRVAQSFPIQAPPPQAPVNQISPPPRSPQLPQVYSAVTNGSQSPPPSVISRSPPPTVSTFAPAATQVSPPTSNRNSSTFSTQARLGNIIEEQSILVSPIEAKIPPRGPSITATPAKLEPDPLPPNFGPVTANTRKKMNWSIPFKAGNNKSDTNVFQKWDKFYPESGSRDASRNSSMTGLNLLMDAKRQMSLASSLFDTRSIMSKIGDYADDKDGRASIASRSYSMSTHPPARTRQELSPRFQAITALRQEGKKSAAIDTAMKLLREYDPDRKVLIVREAEVKKNIKESHKGLSGTGFGYAPIHFFSERKVEANVELELLIEGGADVNAVACKAGMPGTDPFTPLQRAIELGHTELVRILIAANVAIAPPQPPKEASHNLGNKESLTHPLLIACQLGQTQITWLLLLAGGARTLKEFPQRQWHGKSLLHEACWLANVDMVKMLLDYSKVVSQQSDTPQRDEETRMIGSPGQQDQFGATPIMYAIDVRDCTSYKTRAIKVKNRKECLKLLLEHDVHGDINSTTYREGVARILSLKWTRGPGNGHSIFCYADESGDEDLIRMLDPFRYQVSPGLRCSATPQCSASLRSENVQVSTKLDGKNARMQTVRLPSFPELMSTPLNFPSEVEAEADIAPPTFESAIRATSPTIAGGTISGGSDLGTNRSS